MVGNLLMTLPSTNIMFAINHKGNSTLPSTSKVDEVLFMDSRTSNGDTLAIKHKSNSMLTSTSKVDDVWFMDSSTSNSFLHNGTKWE